MARLTRIFVPPAPDPHSGRPSPVAAFGPAQGRNQSDAFVKPHHFGARAGGLRLLTDYADGSCLLLGQKEDEDG